MLDLSPIPTDKLPSLGLGPSKDFTPPAQPSRLKIWLGRKVRVFGLSSDVSFGEVAAMIEDLSTHYGSPIVQIDLSVPKVRHPRTPPEPSVVTGFPPLDGRTAARLRAVSDDLRCARPVAPLSTLKARHAE